MSERPAQIVIVGGGAAGFFAAIAAARADPAARVTILERGRNALAKVAISGGGRCNLTTSITEPGELVAHYPRGGRALRGPFTRFGPRETIDWFTARGVRLKTEPDGRVFPVTDRSSTVIDCLTREAASAGVILRTLANVTAIARTPDGFRLLLHQGEPLSADRLLLATGGERGGFALAASLGHSILPPVPSLFALNVRDERLAGLAGLSVPDVRLRVEGTKLAQRGPMLITHAGLSGPAVLKLSAWGARPLHELGYRGVLEVNWMPEAKEEELRGRLTAARSSQASRAVSATPPGELPRRLWGRLVAAAGVGETQRWADLANRQVHELVGQLLRGAFAFDGRCANKEEFVTCGGVSLGEVDFATMASRLCPGLFLAGELLDIDAVTGGFNFQSAWTTGWLAGLAMARP